MRRSRNYKKSNWGRRRIKPLTGGIHSTRMFWQGTRTKRKRTRRYR